MNLKIAIIGSGPSAFYTAQSLIKKNINCTEVKNNVDMKDYLELLRN